MSDRIAVLNNGVAQQVGTPIELYDKPANRFVADFLGTANLIDGRVEMAAATAVFQADDGIKISLAGRELAGGPGTAMFRPQDLSIAETGDERTGAAVLPGNVQHREFLGSLIRYSVQVGTREILVDDSHHAGGRVFDVGEDVALHLDVDQVQVLTG